METKKIEGFYGGKFFPMHLGHLLCIDRMSKQCDHGVVILFINGEGECDYLKDHVKTEDLNVENRIEQVKKVCQLFPNLEYHVIDCTTLRNPDGTEDWDAETPLVRQFCPHIDYVYSSEPEYDAYFKRAYPEATHILVDVPRIKVPISSTMIRNMINEEEKDVWRI